MRASGRAKRCRNGPDCSWATFGLAEKRLPTRHIDLVVCLSGLEPTTADGFARELAACEARSVAAGATPTLQFPLAVTAPIGFFVYSGSLAVSAFENGKDKRYVFKRTMCDLA